MNIMGFLRTQNYLCSTLAKNAHTESNHEETSDQCKIENILLQREGGFKNVNAIKDKERLGMFQIK